MCARVNVTAKLPYMTLCKFMCVSMYVCINDTPDSLHLGNDFFL